MVKKLAGCLGEYKKYAILTPIIMIGEVVMEVMIPFVMAQIIDKGIQGNGGIAYTVKMGLLMILMALVSLSFGALGGTFAARAGMGFAKNIVITSYSIHYTKLYEIVSKIRGRS